MPNFNLILSVGATAPPRDLCPTGLGLGAALGPPAVRLGLRDESQAPPVLEAPPVPTFRQRYNHVGEIEDWQWGTGGGGATAPRRDLRLNRLGLAQRSAPGSGNCAGTGWTRHSAWAAKGQHR